MHSQSCIDSFADSVAPSSRIRSQNQGHGKLLYDGKVELCSSMNKSAQKIDA
jgi:hypothetical protein